MSDYLATIDAAIAEVDRARQLVGRASGRQVRAAGEIDYLRSVVYAWSRTHRSLVVDVTGTDGVATVDRAYQEVLAATGKFAARTTYVDALKATKTALVELRGAVMVPPSTPVTSVAPPNFSPLATDARMQEILIGRWTECQLCISAGAHLAATVMMGGLLEALFVSKANKLNDKTPLFKAKSTPLDSQTGKPLQLKEWTLRPYIDVGYELGWITRSGKDVAAVLRDYRNYVHPEKEKSHGIKLSEFDSAMFWEITRLLSSQLLAAS